MLSIDNWLAKRRKRAVYRKLDSFSDRLLDDIGITRADIAKRLRGR